MPQERKDAHDCIQMNILGCVRRRVHGVELMLTICEMYYHEGNVSLHNENITLSSKSIFYICYYIEG